MGKEKWGLEKNASKYFKKNHIFSPLCVVHLVSPASCDKSTNTSASKQHSRGKKLTT